MNSKNSLLSAFSFLITVLKKYLITLSLILVILIIGYVMYAIGVEPTKFIYQQF